MTLASVWTVCSGAKTCVREQGEKYFQNPRSEVMVMRNRWL